MIHQEVYQTILKDCQEKNATLIAVSKFQSVEAIQALYDLGHRDFGENYVQELVEKQEVLPKDIRWHFIGNLQRNKVKDIAPFVHLIHSVDSIRLLNRIVSQAERFERPIDVLAQMHIAEEDTKFGMDDAEMIDFFEYYEKEVEGKGVSVKGVMGMSTYTSDQEKVKKEFKTLVERFHYLQSKHFIGKKEDFSIVSMGMSSDYKLALEMGSTMVRVGSSIFGARKEA